MSGNARTRRKARRAFLRNIDWATLETRALTSACVWSNVPTVTTAAEIVADLQATMKKFEAVYGVMIEDPAPRLYVHDEHHPLRPIQRDMLEALRMPTWPGPRL
jgi:hypothetical protein